MEKYKEFAEKLKELQSLSSQGVNSPTAIFAVDLWNLNAQMKQKVFVKNFKEEAKWEYCNPQNPIIGRVEFEGITIMTLFNYTEVLEHLIPDVFSKDEFLEIMEREEVPTDIQILNERKDWEIV